MFDNYCLNKINIHHMGYDDKIRFKLQQYYRQYRLMERLF